MRHIFSFTQYPHIICLEKVSVVISVAEPGGRQGVAEGGVKEWVEEKDEEKKLGG